jgi:hypothetical protein
MIGNWGEVWDSFDKRKKKPANDGGITVTVYLTLNFEPPPSR